MDVDRVSEAAHQEISALAVASHAWPDMRLPFGSCGDLLDEISPAGVLEITQAVGDRIDAGLRRQLINVRFVGEGVGQGRHAPEPGSTRDWRHVVDDHAMIGEIARPIAVRSPISATAGVDGILPVRISASVGAGLDG